MTKIVYNACYGGGVSLSRTAVLRYAELKGWALYPAENYDAGFYSRFYTVTRAEYQQTLAEDPLKAETLVFDDHEIFKNRADPLLVQVIEELGEQANGWGADLQIKELHEGTVYRIEDYDGQEKIKTIDEYVWSIA